MLVQNLGVWGRGDQIRCIMGNVKVAYTASFEKGCRKKMHATIQKGIVGGFDCTVFQSNLNEWYERPRTYVC